MSVYEEYKAQRTSWGINALGTVVVQVELTDGTIGVGCSIGGEPACYIIEKHLKRFVEGQDPRNVELIWDQMWRATMPYGRKGLTVQAISAVDLAIWDCLGRLREEPVYALIGGKTKDKLPVYATTSRPDLAKRWGFNGAKIPCRYGPADGAEGLKKNIGVMAEAREQVGPDFPLRLDCYMALTVPYAIKLAKALVPYDLHWIEECLPPDDFDAVAMINSSRKVRDACAQDSRAVALAAVASTRFRRHHRIASFLAGIGSLAADRRALRGVALWTIGMQLCRFAGTVAVVSAFGLPHPFLAALVILPALDLAGAVPLTPGSFGVGSGAVAVALASRGIGMTDALATGLAIQGVETLVSVTLD